MAEKKFNYQVAFVSVLLALILWSWVTLAKNYTYVIAIPLKIKEMPENLVLNKRIPDSVQVKLEGSGRSFMRLYTYTPSFQLNLSGVSGSQKLELRRRVDEVTFPSDIDIKILEIVSPKYIDVEFSRKSSKKVPIVPDISFSVEPGYIWVSTKIQPDTISIEGPYKLVRNIKELSTEKVDLSKSLLRPVEKVISVKLPEQESNISIFPPEVKIFLDIQRLAENSFVNIPVKVINIPRNTSASSLPATVSLTLKGGDKILANITAANIRAYINYDTDFNPEKKLYIINFDLKENVDIVSHKPRYFEILLRENK